MKETQANKNPFCNTDSNKRYYTYDYFLKTTFGGKCAKIPLDIGLSCPNIDGKCGYGGCIYCSGRGSGDFAESSILSIKEQYNIIKGKLSSKWDTNRCIPYFQAHTNTYAELPFLKEKFEEASKLDGAVGIAIATRADCLEDEKIKYLSELSKSIPIFVELGLQTVHDETARLINRGHTFLDFLDGYNRLRAAGGNINICVHLIFGLPNENEEMMMETAREVAKLKPDMVKFHLLHIIKGTILEKMYNNREYSPLEKADYVRIVAKAIECMPKDTVIARLTGDGMKETLVAPIWSIKKVSVINDIDKYMYENNMYQGRLFEE